jgi:hypothetical protein
MIFLEAHEGIQEVIIQEKKQLRIFCMKDCGGLPFIRMLRSFVILVMFSKEFGSLLEDMICR